jgi:hypothetical protein
MTNEELSEKLGELRGGVAAKSRAYAIALKDLDELLRALKDPAKNAATLVAAAGKLRKDGVGIFPTEDLSPALDRLDEIAKKALDNSAFTFKRDLQEAFAEKKISIDSTTRDRFFVEPFRIEVDGRRSEVNIMYGHDAMNAKPIPLDPSRVISAYTAARKTLVERKSNPSELLKRILEAYRRLLAVQGKQFGERVSVIDVYRELVWLRQSDKFRSAPAKASFSEYPRSHFAYDVRQLQTTNTLVHNRQRLQFGTATIDATDDPNRSIWIPEGPEGGQYLMDVYWKKEGE